MNSGRSERRVRGPGPFRFRLVLPQVLCPAGNRASAWPGGTRTAPPTEGLLFSREEVKKEENKTRKKETGGRGQFKLYNQKDIYRPYSDGRTFRNKGRTPVVCDSVSKA